MLFKYIKIRHRKSKKKKYQVRDWTEHNQALLNRGGIVFMPMEDITPQWYLLTKERFPGGKLKSRNIENQKHESRIVLRNVNMMKGHGMTESYAVIS